MNAVCHGSVPPWRQLQHTPTVAGQLAHSIGADQACRRCEHPVGKGSVDLLNLLVSARWPD
jgi:hypothetical protein